LKITKEIKAGILVIASISLFIWGYSYLKGKDIFTSYKTFYVEYENVEGLTLSAPVTLNGLSIGKVNSILIDSASGKIRVELQLKTDFPISKSSIATIYEPGFIGGKQIAIHPNFEDKELAIDGQKLKGDIKTGLTASLGNKLEPLQFKIEKLMFNTDKLISGLNNILDNQGQADIKNSLSEMNKTITEFHKASTSLNAILDDNKIKINGVVTNFNKISSDFSKISDTLNKANLGKTVKNLEKTLASIDQIMMNLENGKGSMGKILKDETLYNNITNTTKEMELLMQDLRLYPTRYVNVSLFGKKNKPYVAPIGDTIVKLKTK
jgi:phospholipid/cholesterol/gamma-HCH transport system substrate-binding protein